MPDDPFPPARSALGLRRVLAVFGLVACLVGVAVFAATDKPVLAVLFGVVALVTVIDLVVIQRRIRRQDT